ncbi:hypothetical protein NC653_012313 [Populus alba x Populus x berolinensis]|uniref:Uncharacterized protein n=1 Tax=Populus alba x Populus x berolinensis TaxID=444605 RepID=A0AAD6R4U3_9ROSI|nr:hypothetical protein NC653_012313 [Populus alba x Populus x berolinensis]
MSLAWDSMSRNWDLEMEHLQPMAKLYLFINTYSIQHTKRTETVTPPPPIK